jgi:Tfp pilus assembly protein PilN
MIRVNLIGTSRKKSAKARSSVAIPTNIMPLVLVLIVVAAAAGGYLWYSKLDAQVNELTSKIATLQAQKASLDAVIKTNQIYETRKKSLESRIKIIEGLKRNQVNPILAMDVLSDAVQKTQYVWLSQLDQNNAVLSMSGVGTSLNAIADFYANLESTGYFHSLDLANATDAAGNFTFSLKCEFKAPAPKPAAPADAKGGN